MITVGTRVAARLIYEGPRHKRQVNVRAVNVFGDCPHRVARPFALVDPHADTAQLQSLGDFHHAAAVVAPEAVVAPRITTEDVKVVLGRRRKRQRWARVCFAENGRSERRRLSLVAGASHCMQLRKQESRLASTGIRAQEMMDNTNGNCKIE